MSDTKFSHKREVLERELRSLLDRMYVLSAYVDEPRYWGQAISIVAAAQFCHTEDVPFRTKED